MTESATSVRTSTSEHTDPFSRTEIDLIGKADPDRRPDARMIEFNYWAGLSLSELIALAVEDIDLEASLVDVRRALVVGEFKVPKERSTVSVVELIDPALELMLPLPGKRRLKKSPDLHHAYMHTFANSPAGVFQGLGIAEPLAVYLHGHSSQLVGIVCLRACMWKITCLTLNLWSVSD